MYTAALATGRPQTLYWVGLVGVRLGLWLSGMTIDIRHPEHILLSRAAVYAVNHNSNPKPTDTMEAQYSIPYCSALALTRDPGDPRAFDADGYTNPALLAIASRVETRVDDECDAVYPQRFGSRVQLHLEGGVVKEALTLDPHGTPADPCSAAELTAKFSRLAALSPLLVDSAAIARAVHQLDGADSLRDLSRVLRAA